MAIYVRNCRQEWAHSMDNHPFILYIHLILARSRVWQLLITPKHIILGAIYGYTSHAICAFVRQHVEETLNLKSQPLHHILT